MAQIVLSISDEHMPKVVSALCTHFAYPPRIINPQNPIEMIDNPETRAQFARRKLIEFLKGLVKEEELAAALKTTRDSTTLTEANIS